MKQKVKITELEKKISKLEMHDLETTWAVIDQNKYSQSAYTDILKKKINDLQTKYLAAQAEIQRLNKLPNVCFFEEENIEKQHLLA